MYGTLKDIDSRGWRTRLIGAFIAQQVIFALICIVFRGDAVRPTLMYRPNGMTEADRELYYAYYDIGAAVGLNMNFIVYCAMVLPMLILVVYLFNYLHSLRKLQKSERRAALVMIAVCCVSYVAVVVYFSALHCTSSITSAAARSRSWTRRLQKPGSDTPPRRGRPHEQRKGGRAV